MNFNFNWIVELRNSMTMHSMLSLISFFVAILFFISSFFEKSDFVEFGKKIKGKISLKIAGAFLVASLAFISHSSGVYALAIFIVATFITNLDFLENLAAIFWKNKEFWDYRKATLEKANQFEKEEKRNKEDNVIAAVESELSSQDTIEHEKTEKDKTIKSKDFKHSSITFELEVLEKLKESKFFEGFDFNTDIKIQFGKDVKYIFDGLARSSLRDIIVEIKYSKSIISQRLTIMQVKNYIQELNMFNILQNRFSNIKSIIILPFTELSPSIQGDIGLLIYNTDKKDFENLEEIRYWMKN